MTQKERLVELLLTKLFMFSVIDCERIADHLLQNGVIVPPFMIGEDVYCIKPWKLLPDRIQKDQPYRIDYDEDKGFVFVTFTGVFYENEIFKTKEEAEAALKELEA